MSANTVQRVGVGTRGHSRSTSLSWGLRDLQTGSRAQGWEGNQAKGKAYAKAQDRRRDAWNPGKQTSSITRGLQKDEERKGLGQV